MCRNYFCGSFGYHARIDILDVLDVSDASQETGVQHIAAVCQAGPTRREQTRHPSNHDTPPSSVRHELKKMDDESIFAGALPPRPTSFLFGWILRIAGGRPSRAVWDSSTLRSSTIRCNNTCAQIFKTQSPTQRGLCSSFDARNFGSFCSLTPRIILVDESVPLGAMLACQFETPDHSRESVIRILSRYRTLELYSTDTNSDVLKLPPITVDSNFPFEFFEMEFLIQSLYKIVVPLKLTPHYWYCKTIIWDGYEGLTRYHLILYWLMLEPYFRHISGRRDLRPGNPIVITASSVVDVIKCLGRVMRRRGKERKCSTSNLGLGREETQERAFQKADEYTDTNSTPECGLKFGEGGKRTRQQQQVVYGVERSVVLFVTDSVIGPEMDATRRDRLALWSITTRLTRLRYLGCRSEHGIQKLNYRRKIVAAAISIHKK
ncbi:hypothetical protein C8R43DRAFT_943879 [Mycena crocata]|nr:hypothetical protein C8R43DRAFT_943879 [Mycena crocata]